ncbi:tyrosine-type recombinase/integrase [Massilia sp. YIM B02443]|uniref:tyrosine-type recombinase/integrase n=1 Tax=Massilia sp. YIM B02443 TaxID=3050127 RepID=UPI0025B64950|nr:tyrosine-type recombinase/integrase [Massilia sp. YIM B02443]MDN4035882.1 tyrosine-type recombinase/integrase [Massilia sp. YIM B02443]
MSTSIPELSVRSIKWVSGERFAMLVDAETGVPLIDPTVFAMLELRKRGDAHSTIKQAMYAIRILILFLNSKSIDVHYRIHKSGRLFDMGEVEQLTSLCKLQFSEIQIRLNVPPGAPDARAKPKFKFKNGAKLLQAFRARTPERPVLSVHRGTTNIRLGYIHSYLRWLTAREIMRIDADSSIQLATRANVDAALGAIKSKRIHRGNRKSKMKRMGLTTEVITRLHEVLDPESPENPWRPGFNRYRNRLYIYWLLDVALRKGEALGLTLEDIIFGSGSAKIVRRPDNPHDPRSDPPLVKTNERELRINDTLLEFTEEYLEMRRDYVNASHGYLFVSSRRGEALSQSAARDIFYALRRKVSGLPPTLSAHVLRHTWNSLFTMHAFESNMQDKTREDLMKNQNGWSDKSKMPNYYSTLAINKKAQQESIKVQEKIHGFRKRNLK